MQDFKDIDPGKIIKWYFNDEMTKANLCVGIIIQDREVMVLQHPEIERSNTTKLEETTQVGILDAAYYVGDQCIHKTWDDDEEDEDEVEVEAEADAS